MTPLRQTAARWSRWLHIYASMLGLTALLFFSVSGFILNHQSWFIGEPRVVERAIVLPEATLRADRLAVVQTLRRDFDIGGELHTFDQDESEWRLEFRGPGRLVEVSIDPASGDATVREERRGVLAIFADLHRGKSVGTGWGLLVDGAAVALAGVSLTGLIYWLAIPRRRAAAVTLLALGVVLAVLVYLLLVP